MLSCRVRAAILTVFSYYQPTPPHHGILYLRAILGLICVTSHAITLIFSIVLLEAKVSEHDISGGEDQVQTGHPLAGAAEQPPHVSPHLHSIVQYSTVQNGTVQYSTVQPQVLPHLPVDGDVEDWVDQTAANSSYFFAVNIGSKYWKMFRAMFIGEKKYELCPLRVCKSDKIPENDSFIFTEKSHIY